MDTGFRGRGKHSTGSPGFIRPLIKAMKNRIVAGLTATALAASGIVVATATISSATVNPNHGDQGIVLPNYFSYGTWRDKWVGWWPSSYFPVNSANGRVWCIELGQDIGPISNNSTQYNPAVAYLLWKFDNQAYNTGQMSNDESAALQSALYRDAYSQNAWELDRFNTRMSGQSFQGSVTNPNYSGDLSWGDQMWNESVAYQGPYTVHETMGFSGRTVNLTGVSITSDSSGNLVPGFNYTMTITGPAVFDANGGQSLSATSATSDQSYTLTRTGNGDIRVDWSFSDIPNTSIYIGTDPTYQDGVGYAGNSSVSTYDVVHPTSLDFQPGVSTSVQSTVVTKGSPLVDNVSAYVVPQQAGDSWPIDASYNFVPVTVRVDWYGPYPSPQTPSATVPAGAPYVGTDYLTYNGPSTKTTAGTVHASGSGYYTAVAQVVKAQQPAEDQQYIRGDFSDGFWTAGETLFAQMNPSVTTAVANSVVTRGGNLNDNVTLSLSPGDQWLTDSAGNPVPVTAEVDWYGPYSSPQAPQTTAPAGSPLVGTQTVTFTAAGTKVTSGGVTAPGSGYYTAVAKVVKAQQPSAYQQYLQGDATDGFWTPGEVNRVNMTPVLATNVGGSAVINPNGTLADNVTVSLQTGDKWLTDSSGNPIPVTVHVDWYGPYPSPQTPSGTVPAGAPHAGRQDLVFTSAGSKATSGISVSGSGYYTAVATVVKADQPATTQAYLVGDSTDGFWTTNEVARVRMQPAISTAVTTTVANPSDQVKDSVTLSLPTGSKWLTDTGGAPIPVTTRVDWYGPYATPQAAAAAVPSGANHVGREDIVFTAPGTLETAGLTTVNQSGYYTAVASIIKTEQPASTQDYLVGDTVDQFFAPGETAMARMNPIVSTTAVGPVINIGDSLKDNVIVALNPGDQWLTDTGGAPVPVVVHVDWYGPYTTKQATQALVPSDATHVGREDLTYTSAGVQTTAGDLKAPGSGWYTAVATIIKGDQPAQYQNYLVTDVVAPFFDDTETLQVRMNPTITTNAVTRYTADGDPVMDAVTLHLPPGSVFIQGDVVKAVGTLYGPFTSPTAASVEPTPGAPVIGTETLSFTSPGTLTTSGSVHAKGAGFYTWQWIIDPNDVVNDMVHEPFKDQFMADSEATNVLYHVDHSSAVCENQIAPEENACDYIVIRGMVKDHGQFVGLPQGTSPTAEPGWQPDVQTATVTLYGPFDQQPNTVDVPKDAPVEWTGTIKAVNGEYEIGYDGTIQPHAVGYYVFVYHFVGDDRVAPYTSPFNSPTEWVHVDPKNWGRGGKGVISEVLSGGGGSMLAFTGGNPWPLGSLALGLVITGGMALGVKRRMFGSK